MVNMSANEKKLDRRVVRTRKAIMDAFDKLVSSSDVDKITVSAIAREAGIDRKTFYLHYSSVDDLANYKAEKALERVFSTLLEAGTGKTNVERMHIALAEVNRILLADITVYSHIASRLSIDQLIERFDQAARPALARVGLNPCPDSDQQALMRLQFYMAGALSLYTSWLTSDRTEPLETVSDAIESAIAATCDDSSEITAF